MVYQFQLFYEKWCGLSLAPAVQESMCHAQLVGVCLGAWLAAPTNSLLDTTDCCAPLSASVAVLYCVLQRDKIKENKEKIKLNKQLPWLVGNVVEVTRKWPERDRRMLRAP